MRSGRSGDTWERQLESGTGNAARLSNGYAMVLADQRCMQKLNAEPEVNEAMTAACAKEELDGVILPDRIISRSCVILLLLRGHRFPKELFRSSAD